MKKPIDIGAKCKKHRSVYCIPCHMPHILRSAHKKMPPTDKAMLDELQRKGRKIRRGTHTVLMFSWGNRQGIRRAITAAMSAEQKARRKK